MPTTLPRHTITETADIADALACARLRWPGQPDQQLFKNVLLAWADSFGDGSEGARRRREARSELIGGLPGSAYEYSRSEEWPG